MSSTDNRRIVLDIAKGDGPTIESMASVTFCESSASLTVGKLTVHLPWTELATWHAWLAERLQKEG